MLPRRAHSSVVAPHLPDLYPQFRIPSHPMLTSSQHASSALIDHYPTSNRFPHQMDVTDRAQHSSDNGNTSQQTASCYHPSQPPPSSTESRNVTDFTCPSNSHVGISGSPSSIISSNGLQISEARPSLTTTAMYSSSSANLSSTYSQGPMMSSYQQQLEPAMQMQRAPPSQTMDSYQPQIYHQSQSQAQSVADAPSSYQTPSANDFDFLDGMNFLTETLPVPPTSESRQENLDDILSFPEPNEAFADNSLSSLSYPDRGDPFVAGRSNHNTDMVNGDRIGSVETDNNCQNNGNKDSPNTTDVERCRQKNDSVPTPKQMDFQRSAICDYTKHLQPLTIKTETEKKVASLDSHTGVLPARVRWKSKGKPENVCQLLASFDPRKCSDTFREKTNSANVGVHDDKRTTDTTIDGSTMERRSISINVGDFRRKSFLTNALKRFSSQLRTPRLFEAPSTASGTQNNAQQQQPPPYTPPPMLSPIRTGSGLFCRLSRNSHLQSTTSSLFAASDTLADPHSKGNRGASEYEPAPKHARPHSTESVSSSSPQKVNTKEESLSTPVRKNGFCYTGSEANKDLEEIRSTSKCSTASTLNSHSGLSEDLTCAAEEYRKSSSVSEDADVLRKASSTSDVLDDDITPPESDAIPHINRGKDYQAKVKKWADREITDAERAQIPDRDEIMFDCNVIDHLDQSAVEAYELLACSQAVPRPGRNRELALHLLMENKGNIQAAVMDLLRSDTLDWEQYPIIYNSIYNDTDPWSPEDIASFQDAIYKSEKDFHQVAQDLDNKTVKQCVEFYYMWKKACPDDYRKLRNLRRKRQLLEMHQKMDACESYNLRSSARNEGGETTDVSDAESDVTNPSYATDIEHIDETNRVALRGVSPTSQKVGDSRYSDLSGSGMARQEPVKVLDTTLPSPTVFHSSQNNQNHRPAVKKGAQPSADGYFHCRLCDKCFEKVKSLNAHMKSHAMKARAEAEAQVQLNMQFGSQPSVTTVSSRDKNVTPIVRPSANSVSHERIMGQSPLDMSAVTLSPNTLGVNPFDAVSAMSQDLFAQTTIAQEHLANGNLMANALAPLAAARSLNQSALNSMLSQGLHLPQAQALHFLNTLHHPTITH